MKQALVIVSLCAGAIAIAGCQQPLRCGAIGEPCCEVAGGFGCYDPLFCNLGECSASAPTSCAGPPGECDIGLQNCGGGQSCQLGTGTTGCLASGSGIDGDPCTISAECQPGYYCNAPAGVCHRYCCVPAGASCTDRQICIASGEGSIGYCAGEPCDPFAQTGCSMGFTCMVAGGADGRALTVCLTSGGVGVGGACATIDACAPGLVCASPSDTCRPLCRPSQGCAGTCTPLAGELDLGICN